MSESARSKANDGLAHVAGALALMVAMCAAPSVHAGGQPAPAPPPAGDETKPPEAKPAPPAPAPPTSAPPASTPPKPAPPKPAPPAAVAAPEAKPAPAADMSFPPAPLDVSPPPGPRPEKNEFGLDDPIAGWSDGTVFLRSPGNNFILLPSARLHVDAYVFRRPTAEMPQNTILLRRARLELTGWIGSIVYWTLQGDFAAGPPAGRNPVAQSFIATTDNYVAIAPWKDRAILQVGQYDAPFTLENRTSDKYIDFMERSLTVRAFGVPSNKEIGVMLHGQPLTNKAIYYALGAFNGDGQNFRNVDNNLDFMGRAWFAPFAFTKLDALKAITVGGSFWAGKRGATGLPLATQSTQGGFAFLSPQWTLPDGKTPAELHQNGNLTAFAFELNVPIAHRFGARFELVKKAQALEEDDISGAASGKLVKLGQAKLDGTSFYGELWGWILGDDRIIGEPGLQMPTRLKKFTDPRPRHGLLVSARVDHLSETVTTTMAALNDPNVGRTRIIAPELGITYWYSKRFRATFNYVVNLLGGDTTTISKARARNGGSSAEHEFLFRLGIAL